MIYNFNYIQIQKLQNRTQPSNKRLKSKKIEHIQKRLESYQKLVSKKKDYSESDKSLKFDSSRSMSKSELSKYEIAHSISSDHNFILNQHGKTDFYVHSEYVMKKRPKT